MQQALEKHVNQFAGIPYKQILQTYCDVDAKVLQYLKQNQNEEQRMTPNLLQLFLQSNDIQLQLQYVKEYKTMKQRISSSHIRIESFCSQFEICLQKWNPSLWNSCWNTFLQLLEEQDWNVVLSIWFSLQWISFGKFRKSILPLCKISKEFSQLCAFVFCREWVVLKQFFEQAMMQCHVKTLIFEKIELITKWLQHPSFEKKNLMIPKYIQLYCICEMETNLMSVENWMQKELLSSTISVPILKQMICETLNDLPQDNMHKLELLKLYS